MEVLNQSSLANTESNLYICWVNYGILFIIFLLINNEIEHLHVSLKILIFKSVSLAEVLSMSRWYHFAFDRLQFFFFMYLNPEIFLFVNYSFILYLESLSPYNIK